ncbi:tRNA 2-thiouridine(34) synthase MnmA [candidate division Kazan bacterium RBG_13_50_9]|uniref:tRNA-specific 2-thiouridylase MnmA n=1 Tax=candidate division Kazan bacterium RBG_13_50_9 TaxID=1798535 RepID=A0A1F4NU03_UNCK3|nr:MAG: tRNA 2-thiouridine(34) synthase MnmA [candidate division Kazan bacterium RBG_13_50_9]
MSGGVDSSVTAYLLKEQGYQIVGVFMKNWSFPVKRITECPLYQDYLDMVSVCKFLKVPYLVFSFEKEYRKRVIDDFFKEYRAGRTPNPDVLCNREIKFDLFLKEALKRGADLMATGHHIRSRKTPKGYQLLRGKDPIKDQTYFVYPITQAQLGRCLFPIGEYTKAQIREIAKQVGLPTAAKRDSQGICFIGRIDAKDFLKTKLLQRKGDIVDLSGRKRGEHEGAWFYTLGQRRIVGLSGTAKPLYVIKTDVRKNLVIVGSDSDTYTKVARIGPLHLINPKEYTSRTLVGKQFLAKSRYTPELSRGVLKKDSKGFYFQFSQPERAVTSGQSLVLYQGQVCIGGGVIKDNIK